MPTSRILGPDGEPIRTQELLREIATPTIDGTRNVWFDGMADGLTPDRLSVLLREAADGDPEPYLTLAEEMEERDLHYLGVLGDRKRALTGLEITVESPTDDDHDKAITEAVRGLVADPIFETVTEDMQDALGKSFSVTEIIWDTSEKQWMPKAYVDVDQRWFFFDRATRRELRMRDIAAPLDGLALQPFKFIQHRPRIKSGIPIRNGFARIAGFSWLCKLYALKDWMAFVEVFGMPLRLGKYGPNASRGDISVLKRAVANIGSDAAAVIPEAMKIEFIEAASGSGGADVFERLCDYLDKQVSKAVLGQTTTTDSGGSLAQAKVHNEVRLDILGSDAKGVAGSLNRDLVRPFVDLNFGPQKRYPRIVINVPQPEDLKALTSALKDLVPLGLKVEQSVIRDKLGLPDPALTKNVDLLVAPLPAAPPPVVPPVPMKKAANQRGGTALNAQMPSDIDEVDLIAADGLAEWEMQIDPAVSAIEKLCADCSSFEELLERLPTLAGEIELGELQMALATANFKARATGDAKDLVS